MLYDQGDASLAEKVRRAASAVEQSGVESEYRVPAFECVLQVLLGSSGTAIWRKQIADQLPSTITLQRATFLNWQVSSMSPWIVFRRSIDSEMGRSSWSLRPVFCPVQKRRPLG